MRFLSRFCIMILTLLFCPFVFAKMVYLHQQDDIRRVALANDQGQFLRFLTPENLDAYHPEISADGRYVAYSIGVIQPTQVSVAIHVQDLETGTTEIWTPQGNQYIHAEFSGNGEYLAYSGAHTNQRQNIHLIHLPTERAKGPYSSSRPNGNLIQVYKPEAEVIESKYDCYFPAVASDGSFVVYHQTKDASSKSTSKELVLFDRRDQTSSLLTPQDGHAMVPSLSADNRYVTYAGITQGQWDIHLLDRWTGQDRQLTDDSTMEFTPVFAPDGSITYTNISADSTRLDLYRIPAEQVFNSKVKVMPHPFIHDPDVMEYVPSFSGQLHLSLEKAPSIVAPARSSFGAIEYQNKIYIAGGHHGPEHTYPPESFLDRLDIYDTQTQSWSQGASMSVPRHGFEMIAYNGYLYVFGGFAYSPHHSPGWRSLDIIERYDIKKNQWKVLPTKLPRQRSSNVIARMGSKVYLIGGWDSTPSHDGDVEGHFHREIDVFDLTSEVSYESQLLLPDPLRRAFTAVTHDENIYLLGGISPGANHFDWLNHVTVLNVKTNTWHESTPLPFATFAPGAGVINDTLYLFGGMNRQFEYQDTIYSFDINLSLPWLNSGRYLNERKGFPIVVNHPAGGLAILGGHTYRYTSDGTITDTPVATFEHLREL